MLDVRLYWDFEDIPTSRTALAKLLEPADLVDRDRLIVMSQLARCESLCSQAENGLKILQDLEPQFLEVEDRASAFFYLELGRCYRTLKDIDLARQAFLSAVTSARRSEEFAEDLEIDAEHMLALLETDPELRKDRHLSAIELAETSTHPWANRWLGSLYNNLGWDLADAEDLSGALTAFREALKARQKFQPELQFEIHVAKWCLAHILRRLEHFEESRSILEELSKDEIEDEYVQQELDLLPQTDSTN